MTQQRQDLPRTSRRDRGFTLVELMVVIVILGGLIAVVGPNIWKALTEGNEGQARTQMKTIYDAAQRFMITNRGKLPSDLAELTEPDDRDGEPYMDRIPKDPWGGEYEIKHLDKRKFKIICGGPDEQIGTEDDLEWPDSEEE